MASSFFWKFSRDGDYSETYVSFIADVPGEDIKIDNKKTWSTSFNTLSMILLLLQDVEIFNSLNGQTSGGLTSSKFRSAVRNCGYAPPPTNPERRQEFKLVCGQAVMGCHTGSAIDWGYYEDAADDQSIQLDVSAFRPVLHVFAATGKSTNGINRDRLSCYRAHQKFVKRIWFWDIMPRHINMPSILDALKNCDKLKTEGFISKTLGWTPL